MRIRCASITQSEGPAPSRAASARVPTKWPCRGSQRSSRSPSSLAAACSAPRTGAASRCPPRTTVSRSIGKRSSSRRTERREPLGNPRITRRRAVAAEVDQPRARTSPLRALRPMVDRPRSTSRSLTAKSRHAVRGAAHFAESGRPTSGGRAADGHAHTAPSRAAVLPRSKLPCSSTSADAGGESGSHARPSQARASFPSRSRQDDPPIGWAAAGRAF